MTSEEASAAIMEGSGSAASGAGDATADIAADACSWYGGNCSWGDYLGITGPEVPSLSSVLPDTSDPLGLGTAADSLSKLGQVVSVSVVVMAVAVGVGAFYVVTNGNVNRTVQKGLGVGRISFG